LTIVLSVHLPLCYLQTFLINDNPNQWWYYIVLITLQCSKFVRTMINPRFARTYSWRQGLSCSYIYEDTLHPWSNLEAIYLLD
jgi:hypothetical protein